MSIKNFNELESPTRVHHPTKESYVVSAEEAKELFKQGWYPRRKFAKEAAKGKPEVAAKKTNEKKSIVAPSNRRKELEKMKFFKLRSLHKKVVGQDERNLKKPELIEEILKQEAE
ncbi:MAG: hypothetical protein V3V88_03465 [Dehalococcoidia bacterium]